jgi:hypothetical protein
MIHRPLIVYRACIDLICRAESNINCDSDTARKKAATNNLEQQNRNQNQKPNAEDAEIKAETAENNVV